MSPSNTHSRSRTQGVSNPLLRSFLLFGLASIIATSSVPARAAAIDSPADAARWRWGAWLGGAEHSPVGTHLGATPDRDHLFLAGRVSARVVRFGPFDLRGASELVPIAIVTNNPTYTDVRRRVQGRTVIETVESGRSPVWGVGLSPLGFELQFHMTPRASLYGSGSVGGLWFTREVPILHSRAFNYTFETGGGVAWRHGDRDWLTLGYQFHHFSNNYTAPENPGVDANMIVLGWQRAWHGRR